MSTIICRAIAGRKVIQFFYDGGIRIVEPHCHGVSTAGNEVLRGYQISGYSESGKPVGWKLFAVAQMSNVTILNEDFPNNRPFYNPNDSAMAPVHCHV